MRAHTDIVGMGSDDSQNSASPAEAKRWFLGIVSVRNPRSAGIYAALASALFLGMAPVFGRQAILLGMTPLALVAIRTTLAALLLLGVMFLFYRRFLYIYPAGLLGCLLAGLINGLGSLFYYSALGRIDASLVQLLNSIYPLFLVLWLALDNQPPTRLTLFRILLALPAVGLLVGVNNNKVDPIGVIYMLISAALYALHLPFNQRVLYDMPAPTVTLYTLLAMSAVVVPTFLFSGSFSIQANGAGNAMGQFWWPVLGLTLVTFFSRLTLFVGVKHLGGMQTALLSLGELLVTLTMAHLWLGEHFTVPQWIGAALLVISLMLVGLEKSPPTKRGGGGFLSWLTSANLFQESLPPTD
jgi:drug/metabolite transporter (DMT)-like permease